MFPFDDVIMDTTKKCYHISLILCGGIIMVARWSAVSGIQRTAGGDGEHGSLHVIVNVPCDSHATGIRYVRPSTDDDEGISQRSCDATEQSCARFFSPCYTRETLRNSYDLHTMPSMDRTCRAKGENILNMFKIFNDGFTTMLKIVQFSYDCLTIFLGFYFLFLSRACPTTGLCESGWTHRGRDKMADFSQTTFSNAFSSMKMLTNWFKFHWNLFPCVHLTKSQHWFRKWLGAD